MLFRRNVSSDAPSTSAPRALQPGCVSLNPNVIQLENYYHLATTIVALRTLPRGTLVSLERFGGELQRFFERAPARSLGGIGHTILAREHGLVFTTEPCAPLHLQPQDWWARTNTAIRSSSTTSNSSQLELVPANSRAGRRVWQSFAHAVERHCRLSDPQGAADADRKRVSGSASVRVMHRPSSSRGLSLDPRFIKRRRVVAHAPGKSGDVCRDVRLMRSISAGSVIFNAHGAGMLNSLWLAAPSCVVEAFPPGFVWRMYEELLNVSLVKIVDQGTVVRPADSRSQMLGNGWRCHARWCRMPLKRNNIVLREDVLEEALVTCAEAGPSYAPVPQAAPVPSYFGQAHRHQARPSSAAAVAAFAERACLSAQPGSSRRAQLYQRLAPVLAVHVRGVDVFASDPRETAHHIRACHTLHALHRALHHSSGGIGRDAERGRTPTPTTFAVNLHDGCYSARQVPITTLSYGVRVEACPLSVPLPILHTEHNHVWDHGAPNASAFAVRMAAENPWNSKVAKAVFRGSASDMAPRDGRGGGLASSRRMQLALKTLLFPELIDAKLSRAAPPSRLRSSAGDVLEARLGNASARLPFAALFGYKYVMELAGAGAPFHLPSLLLGSSVVILQAGWLFWFSSSFADVSLSGELGDAGLIVHARTDLEDIIPIVAGLVAKDHAARARAERTAARALETFTEARLAATWAELLAWLRSGSTTAREQDGRHSDDAASTAPAGMRPLREWVARGVCHDPRLVKGGNPKDFYKRIMKRGRVGVDFRRPRKRCEQWVPIG